MHFATTSSSGSIIRIDHLEGASVDSLEGLIDNLPAGAVVTVDLAHARSVEPLALVRLHELVHHCAESGRNVLLRGLTLAQARLVALAQSGRPPPRDVEPR
jgi:hypothetical protein